jgi:hypothetical protein
MSKDKEFLTLEEAAAFIGMKRATVYNYMHDLNIAKHKFKRDRRSYLALTDVKRMKEYKEKPWTDDTQPRINAVERQEQ